MHFKQLKYYTIVQNQGNNRLGQTKQNDKDFDETGTGATIKFGFLQTPIRQLTGVSECLQKNLLVAFIHEHFF